MQVLLWIVFGLLTLGTFVNIGAAANNPRISSGVIFLSFIMSAFTTIVIFLAAMNWQ